MAHGVVEVKEGGILNRGTSEVLNMCPLLPITLAVDQASETHKQQPQPVMSIGCPPSGLPTFYKAADGRPRKNSGLPITHSSWPTVGAKDVMCEKLDLGEIKVKLV